MDNLIKEQKYDLYLELCLKNNFYLIGLYLADIWKINNKSVEELKNYKHKNQVRVKLLCNWCPSEQLAYFWDKMSQGNGIWNNIQIVTEEPVDYYVIINKAQQGAFYDKKKTILFRMEPNMHKYPEIWGEEWAKPKSLGLLKVISHEETYNNNEWHLSKTYRELSDMKIVKTKDMVISTILSDRYSDPGHIKRVDFVKYLDTKGIKVEVYGNNKWEYKYYQRSLPYQCKDDGIFPYKYTFNAENQCVKNYYTEKLIDGILGECLVFYWGCPNIRELIDPRAYVQLSLSNFEEDYNIMKKAIEEDWHKIRLPYILEAKKKILNETQFFPRLEKIIYELKVEKET